MKKTTAEIERENLAVELSRIAERFDLTAIQFIAERYQPGASGGSELIPCGYGSIYARKALTERWLNRIEAEWGMMDSPDSDVVWAEAWSEEDDDDGDEDD